MTIVARFGDISAYLEASSFSIILRKACSFLHNRQPGDCHDHSYR